MRRIITISLVAIVIFIFLPDKSGAQKITIAPLPHLPPYFFVVDKSKQEIYLFSYNSTLRLLMKKQCSTGNRDGDKFSEGDMRTPEGVYFITHRIRERLNYTLYGGIAYGLNYPNPVDRIFGKYGHGIWLHGRGKRLLPRDTKGCVAVHTQFLYSLQHIIKQGFSPILIAREISILKRAPKKLSQEEALILQRVKRWKTLWERKDPEFFSLYNPLLFSRSSGKRFSSFVAKKLGYFKRYKWIDIFIPKIYLVKGPYYWVSFFYQYFRSPLFESEGVKRLYWMKVGGGWKIVGSEWREKALHLHRRYLAESKKRITMFLDRWLRAWKGADIREYALFYDKNASQNNRRGLNAIVAHKKKIWSQSPPLSIQISQVHIKMVRSGFEVSFLQDYWAKDYHDRGKKILVIEPHEGSYLIERESWSKK